MFVIARIRLASDTRAIQTKTGTRMERVFGFADIGGEAGLPVGIVAFSNLADELAKYGKGATLRVSGSFQANDYTNKAGEEVHGYQITAEGLAGVKSARGKRQEQQKKPVAPSAEFEDELAF